MDNDWLEVDRLTGPDHPKGPACVIVSKRGEGEYSFVAGFMNGRIFRPQRYFPGNRVEELLDLLEDAAEKYPTGTAKRLSKGGPGKVVK